MTYTRDRGVCLTCGGPARICATSDRCVGLDHPGLRPPPLEDETFSRTLPTETSFGWQVKAALTGAVWLFGAYAASRSAPSGRPLLVFLGVPYVAAAAALTWVTWRPHRVRR